MFSKILFILKRKNLINIFLFFFVLSLPFVADYTPSFPSDIRDTNIFTQISSAFLSSGKGYEIPKVTFTIVILILFCEAFWLNKISKNLREWNKSTKNASGNFFFLILCLSLLLVLSFDYRINILFFTLLGYGVFSWFIKMLFCTVILYSLFNAINSLIIKKDQINDKGEMQGNRTVHLVFLSTTLLVTIGGILLEESLGISAFIGNPFRYQGILLYLLIFTFVYILFLNRRKLNVEMIIVAFIASCTAQALIGISQFISYSEFLPELIDQGKYINGTFGQSNFFSGFLMIGILLSFYKILFTTNARQYRNLMLFLFTIITCSIALVMSLSLWGILSTLIGCLLLGILLISKRFFKEKVINFIVIASVFLLFTVFIFGTSQIRNFGELSIYTSRRDIWDSIVNIMDSEETKFEEKLFGYGFDNLNKVFRKFNLVHLANIDRAHNLFLDVLIQNGIIGLLAFLFFLIFIILRITFRNKKSNLEIVWLTILISFLFRSLVNESGIVNIFSLFLIVVILHSLYTINTEKS